MPENKYVYIGPYGKFSPIPPKQKFIEAEARIETIIHPGYKRGRIYTLKKDEIEYIKDHPNEYFVNVEDLEDIAEELKLDIAEYEDDADLIKAILWLKFDKAHARMAGKETPPVEIHMLQEATPGEPDAGDEDEEGEDEADEAETVPDVDEDILDEGDEGEADTEEETSEEDEDALDLSFDLADLEDPKTTKSELLDYAGELEKALGIDIKTADLNKEPLRKNVIAAYKANVEE